MKKIAKSDYGKKVFVYYNLHKHLWSIKEVKTGLVIGHSHEVLLKDVIYKVSQAGRNRVLSTGQKNVHAGCVGILTPIQSLNLEDGVQITYNPFKYSSFVEVGSMVPVNDDKLILMKNKKVFAFRA